MYSLAEKVTKVRERYGIDEDSFDHKVPEGIFLVKNINREFKQTLLKSFRNMFWSKLDLSRCNRNHVLFLNVDLKRNYFK